MKIRTDFLEVEQQLNRLVIYANQAEEYDTVDWSRLKRLEDFNRIYTLPEQDKYEEVYKDGRSLAGWLSEKLSSFIRVGDFPTLKSFVDSFTNTWISEIEELETDLLKTEEIAKERNAPYVILQMVRLFKKEIEMLKAVRMVLEELRNSTLYKRESGIKISELDQIMTKNNITFNNASNVQIGDKNKMVITQTLNSVIEKIDQSDATPEAKDEAKSKLRDFLNNPLVTSIIGGVTGGLIGLGG